ncbi:MAG: polymer-forming cytoskeletal protein [Myxococcota bacterium]|jgi:cytoskeletal protein CcmA (bactofilin family)|nr:polymer-forming cytoskeletal protein [bacterium]MDP6074749.1 polymer-forming cytoskeletal protein [Myxococcota bacterium]MDP6242799.1 polymer-forming cytoskeletal protein [Myxococcota bacterium]MDP7076341.1 polymer-forming cytoskeletal protein [Myxococcota bacterium]MDP7299987.1 polymer-forming cytoskeletal protein [Myxococcota bacterium]
MALKSFGRSGGSGGVTAAASAPVPSGGPGSGGLTAFIDQGSEFEGKLSFKDTARIDGNFRGEIASENTLIIGESGVVSASICAKTIAVSGTVEGDLTATTKVVLHKTARIRGNVKAPSLVIEEGAVLQGHVKMGGSKEVKAAGNLKAIHGGKPAPPAEDEK